MGRKNSHRYTIFQNKDASASFDNKNAATDVQFLDNLGIQVNWTGTPVGILKVLVSNDVASPTDGIPVVNWSELDLDGGVPAIDNTNSDLIINLHQLPFKWLAVEYVKTSGTGAITIQLTSKMVGG